MLRMLPIFFTTVLYWTVYMQMGTLFVQQGTFMDRRLRNGFEIPAASLNLFNTLSIVALIPLYDGVINPLLTRAGYQLTLLKRIGEWGGGGTTMGIGLKQPGHGMGETT